MAAAEHGATGDRCQPNGLACNEITVAHVAMGVDLQHFGNRLRTLALALDPDQAKPSSVTSRTTALIRVPLAHSSYQPWRMA